MKEVTAFQHYPVVVVEDSKPFTTSLNVAQFFGKRHDHVLRDIENLDVPEAFSLPNFGESNYVDSRGKIQRMYKMTRDGFTILVMGYTGKRAMEFKIAYINQFNAMEAWIKEPRLLERLSDQDKYIDLMESHLRLVTRRANKISEKEKAEILAYKRQGLGTSDIAAKMLRSPSSIRGHVAAARKAGHLPEVR